MKRVPVASVLFICFAAVVVQAQSPGRLAQTANSIRDGVDFGKFVGEVVARWLDDGRTMVLTEPFAYVDPQGFTWRAAKGSQIDGASIPRIAWTLIGGPFEGPYRAASVIHDVACVERRQDWRRVHRAFYTAMRAAGVGVIQAKTMYAAVYHFGPRWSAPCPPIAIGCIIGDPPKGILTEGQFQELARQIELREGFIAHDVDPGPPLTLEDIEDYRPK